MRLTLRTLLAYLDDILEPAQAKEIGDKLNESSFASSLVSRIREVMRRRRLTAPTLSGPGVGIDPNTVAEYLDNTLPPDGVADVEKICLESDVHLAEAAACHQILTLALGEPVEVATQTRDRMYALGPAASKVVLPPSIATRGELSEESLDDVLSQAQSASASPRNGQHVVTPAKKSEIPDYLRSGSNVKRMLGYVIALVVLICWGVTVIKNSPFQGGANKDTASGTGGVQVAAANVNKHVDDEGGPDGQMEPEFTGQKNTDVDADESPRGVKRSTSDVDSALTTDEQPSPPVEPKGTAAKNRRDTARTHSDEPKPAIGREDDSVPPAAAPVVISAKYVSTEGVALHYLPREERWFVLPRGAQVIAGANLAVPEPFQCQLELDEHKGLVTIMGHSVVEVTRPTADGRFGLDLQRGQFIVRGTGSAEDGLAPLNLRIGVAGELWRLELQSGATCGLMLKPKEPSKLVENPDRNSYEGAFYVVGGIAVITDPVGQAHEIKGPDWLELPLAVADADGKLPKKRPLLVVPNWMGPQKLSSTLQSKATVFEKKFALDEAVELTVPELAADANPLISHMATECLGLIEAYGPLVSVLRSQHVEARKAAITELRLWLPRHQDNKEMLKAELAKRFPPEDADVVYRLLWGFEIEDARNKQTSTQLIDWMADPELAIRELAFYQVYRLTGKTRDYQADATTTKLHSSLKAWQAAVKKDGGLLPVPKPTPNPQ
ncbi:MAG: hypothetical protein HY290_19265 [Planctomycetia bacterium]|nr:hypothetical protein [Planctomycetia bacterium]